MSNSKPVKAMTALGLITALIIAGAFVAHYSGTPINITDEPGILVWWAVMGVMLSGLAVCVLASVVAIIAGVLEVILEWWNE